MASLNTAKVASLLREMGSRSALAGDNPYRARAYGRAADSLAALASPLGEVIDKGRLREIPGVGEAIADIITRLHETGRHPSLDRLRAAVPNEVVGLLQVPGLRPDRAMKLFRELGISSLAEL